MPATKYTYSISGHTLNGVIAPDKLKKQIQESQIVTALNNGSEGQIQGTGDVLDIWFADALSTNDQTILTSIVNNHDGIPEAQVSIVGFSKQNKENYPIIEVRKDFHSNSKILPTVNWADRTTWWVESQDITDEVLTTSTGLLYLSAHQNWINLNEVTNRVDISGKTVTIKVNDVEVTSGFTIDYSSGSVTFDSDQSGSTIKASYSYENGSMWELTPPVDSGLVYSLDYIELQFSAGLVFPANSGKLVFEAVYNGPAIPAMSIPANTDVVVRSLSYNNAKDFLNMANMGVVMEPFGELTAKVLHLPFNYTTGYTVKARGDVTTDISNNEINAFRLYIDSNEPFTSAEIASATFYIFEDTIA